jgi:hypothetical protein
MLNSSGVGEPDIWVCQNGVFQQLNVEQIQSYIECSESLDKTILSHLKAIPLPSFLNQSSN